MNITEKIFAGFTMAVLFAWLAFCFCVIPDAFKRDNDDINGEDGK